MIIAIGFILYYMAAVYGNEIIIEGIEKHLVVNPVLYIFSLILGFALAAVCIMAKKLTIEIQYAVLGAVAGIVFNLAGEFLFGAVLLLLAGSAFVPAVIASGVSLPATLINGSFSIFGAVAIYIPLSKAIARRA